jgi:drug/metabolite transporter (DMT)-like permease
MGQHITTTALIVGSMVCTVLANLSLKQGDSSAWLPNIVNLHVMGGAAFFAFAFLFYALVLRRLPLSLAQAIFSVQFVLVILAAHLVLHESIGGVRWLGIGLMAAGLLVVGMSPGPTAVATPTVTTTAPTGDERNAP